MTLSRNPSLALPHRGRELRLTFKIDQFWKFAKKKDLTQRRKDAKACLPSFWQAQRNYLASLHLCAFALKNGKFFCQASA
jgi:hypothetical protein